MPDDEKSQPVHNSNIITAIQLSLVGLAAFIYVLKNLVNDFHTNKPEIVNGRLILIDPLTKKLDTVTIQEGSHLTTKDGWASYIDNSKDAITHHIPADHVYDIQETPAADPSATKANTPK